MRVSEALRGQQRDLELVQQAPLLRRPLTRLGSFPADQPFVVRRKQLADVVVHGNQPLLVRMRRVDRSLTNLIIQVGQLLSGHEEHLRPFSQLL